MQPDLYALAVTLRTNSESAMAGIDIMLKKHLDYVPQLSVLWGLLDQVHEVAGVLENDATQAQ